MNKKILASLIFLSSCKASQLAATPAPTVDLETCSIPNSTLLNIENETILDCVSTSVNPMSLTFKSSGDACHVSYDENGNEIASSCTNTWARSACDTVTITSSANEALILGDIAVTEHGFGANVSVGDASDTRPYVCVKNNL